jgi:hypothetical protein
VYGSGLQVIFFKHLRGVAIFAYAQVNGLCIRSGLSFDQLDLGKRHPEFVDRGQLHKPVKVVATLWRVEVQGRGVDAGALCGFAAQQPDADEVQLCPGPGDRRFLRRDRLCHALLSLRAFGRGLVIRA